MQKMVLAENKCTKIDLRRNTERREEKKRLMRMHEGWEI